MKKKGKGGGKKRESSVKWRRFSLWNGKGTHLFIKRKKEKRWSDVNATGQIRLNPSPEFRLHQRGDPALPKRSFLKSKQPTPPTTHNHNHNNKKLEFWRGEFENDAVSAAKCSEIFGFGGSGKMAIADRKSSSSSDGGKLWGFFKRPFRQSAANTATFSSSSSSQIAHHHTSSHVDGPHPHSSSSVSSVARSLLPTRRRLKLDPSNKLYFPCMSFLFFTSFLWLSKVSEFIPLFW